LPFDDLATLDQGHALNNTVTKYNSTAASAGAVKQIGNRYHSFRRAAKAGTVGGQQKLEPVTWSSPQLSFLSG
jgi:hypothetical protein